MAVVDETQLTDLQKSNLSRAPDEWASKKVRFEFQVSLWDELSTGRIQSEDVFVNSWIRPKYFVDRSFKNETDLRSVYDFIHHL